MLSIRYVSCQVHTPLCSNSWQEGWKWAGYITRWLLSVGGQISSTQPNSHKVLISQFRNLHTPAPSTNMSDLLNKAKGALGGSGSSSQPAGGQKEDYGDKALDMGEKKMGMSQNRETNEKITDAGRGMYEKSTGKQVSDKVCDTRYEFLVLREPFN